MVCDFIVVVKDGEAPRWVDEIHVGGVVNRVVITRHLTLLHDGLVIGAIIPGDSCNLIRMASQTDKAVRIKADIIFKGFGRIASGINAHKKDPDPLPFAWQSPGK